MPFNVGLGVDSIFGAGLNYFGQRSANRANERMAREQMDFQRSSNREQMAFQERMSNTAYQRSIADMRAAGVNPILAFSQGGASSPAGSSSAGASSTHQNKFAGAVSSALQVKQIEAQVKQIEAMTDIAKAELVEKQATASLFADPRYGRALKFLQLLTQPINSARSLFK